MEYQWNLGDQNWTLILVYKLLIIWLSSKVACRYSLVFDNKCFWKHCVFMIEWVWSLCNSARPKFVAMTTATIMTVTTTTMKMMLEMYWIICWYILYRFAPCRPWNIHMLYVLFKILWPMFYSILDTALNRLSIYNYHLSFTFKLLAACSRVWR